MPTADCRLSNFSVIMLHRFNHRDHRYHRYHRYHVSASRQRLQWSKSKDEQKSLQSHIESTAPKCHHPELSDKYKYQTPSQFHRQQLINSDTNTEDSSATRRRHEYKQHCSGFGLSFKFSDYGDLADRREDANADNTVLAMVSPFFFLAACSFL